MDLEIRQFHVSILNFVKESKLPAEVKKIVLENILSTVTEQANIAINEQVAAEEGKKDAKGV